MSKSNKFNRFPNKSDFKEIPQEAGARNKTSASVPQKPESFVYDSNEDTNFSFFTKYNFSSIGTFLGGFWGKLAAYSKSTASKTWGWIWGGLRQIPSYCVIRWDTEMENEAELPVTPPKTAPAKIEPAKIGEKPKFEGKAEGKNKVSPAKIEYDADEDELAMSRWWNISIKTAAVAVAILILVGGYFAVKSLLTKSPTNAMALEGSENRSNTNDGDDIEVAVTPEYVPAMPNEIPVLPVIKEPQETELLALDPFPLGSFFDKDPFSVQTATVVEAAPPVANDPCAVTNVAKEESTRTLAALQPLAVLESADSTQTVLSQLQPLVPINSSAFSFVEVANAPVPTTATANTSVAGNFAERRTQRNSGNNATFSQAPTPPVVNTITQTTVQQTLPVIELIREIVPQIPFSGTVQDVPPPIPTVAEILPNPAVYASESTLAIPKDAPVVAAVTPVSVVAAASPVNSAYANEPAPAIPRDAPVTATPVPVVAVPAASASFDGPPTVESSPKILAADSQPIDRQLRERLQELRGESDVAPSSLRFERVTAVSEESTLRFTPRQQPPPAIADGGLLGESVCLLQELLPSSSGTDQDSMWSEIASLETSTPMPVRAVAAPAYRNERADGERGMTFQNRIDSEIKRSPSETKTYTVQQGDTYMTISDQFYGTSLLYTALAAHNQQLGIGWRPTEGVVIEVPTTEYLRTHYSETKPLLVAQSSSVRYIVQEGDTVFRLATDKLQDSTRWREIYAINSDRLQNVRNLKPGMEILLPDKKL